MNWNWLPWRNSEEQSEDSTDESKVISGSGPKRVIVNESEQTD